MVECILFSNSVAQVYPQSLGAGLRQKIEAPTRGRQETEGAPSSIPRVMKKGRGVKRIKPSPRVSDTDALKDQDRRQDHGMPITGRMRRDQTAAPRGGRKKTTIDTTIQEDRIGVLPAQCPGKGQQTNENSDDGMPTKKEDEGKINRREDDGMPNRLEEGKINRRGGGAHRGKRKANGASNHNNLA